MSSQLPSSVPPQRMCDPGGGGTPLIRFYAVTPDGRIKTIRYERNVSSPLLRQVWGLVNSRPTILLNVELSYTAKELGYGDLLKMLQDEDREEDFAAIVQWYELAEGASGIDPLPDDYLPDALLRRRLEGKKKLAPKLPPPKKRKPSKDGAA